MSGVRLVREFGPGVTGLASPLWELATGVVTQGSDCWIGCRGVARTVVSRTVSGVGWQAAATAIRHSAARTRGTRQAACRGGAAAIAQPPRAMKKPLRKSGLL